VLRAFQVACARLARRGTFIVKSGSGTWPDGTPAELYTFRHDLYRELLYLVSPAKRGQDSAIAPATRQLAVRLGVEADETWRATRSASLL
jgi:hypothetical protein